MEVNEKCKDKMIKKCKYYFCSIKRNKKIGISIKISSIALTIACQKLRN